MQIKEQHAPDGHIHGVQNQFSMLKYDNDAQLFTVLQYFSLLLEKLHFVNVATRQTYPSALLKQPW